MKDDIVCKIRQFVLWFTPTGWTLRQLQYYRNEVRASGVLTIGGLEIQINKLLPTCYNGIYLVYSVDEYNERINDSINYLKYQIKQLENKLR